MSYFIAIPVSDLVLARLAALRGLPRYSPALLARWDWALSRAAAPCPPLIPSGLEHTDRTALARPPQAERVAAQSASKGRG